jgi:hypothetical protein
VRCAGCETTPLISAQYCECCGSRLSLRETSALEESALPVGDAAMAREKAAPFAESLWSQLMTSAAPPAMDSLQKATAADVAVSLPKVPEATMTSVDHEVARAKAEAMMADEARAREARAAAVRMEAVRTEAVRTEAVRAEAVRTNAANTLADSPSGTDAANAPKAPKPAVVNKHPTVPVPSQHARHRIALAAAAVVITAIGVGAYWLRSHRQPHPVSVVAEQQTLAATGVTAAAPQPPARVLPPEAATATRDLEPVAALPRTSALDRPKPTALAPPPNASVSVRKPATQAPAPAAALAPNVVATASSPTPAPPSGPFFETKDVNEAPRVATRVEPRLPDELRTRPVNEIVIARVLVSQGGYPSRVSLLRRSKTGVLLDEAVVAALNQWTFSPARKRGEAVSCWFNIGVPVGRPD